MKTRYIGIESVVIQEEEFVTIACNVMFEGLLYDEPEYVNIFCTSNEFLSILENENNEVATLVGNDIAQLLTENKTDIIQLDLPDYVNAIEWKLNNNYLLEKIGKEEMCSIFKLTVLHDLEY